MNRNLKAFYAKIVYSPLGNWVAQWLRIPKLYAKYRIRAFKKEAMRIAKREFLNETAKGSIGDFKNALDKHWVSYNEYAYQYEFYNKRERERALFQERRWVITIEFILLEK